MGGIVKQSSTRMAEKLPYTVAWCGSKSDGAAPQRLPQGRAWLTDLPTARAAIRVDLGHPAQLAGITIDARDATHVEVRRHEGGAGLGALLVPKTELRSMLDHKRLCARGAPPRGTRRAAIAIRADEAPCQVVDVYAMCLWEPVTAVGLTALSFTGTLAVVLPYVPKPAAAVAVGDTAPPAMKRARDETTAVAAAAPKAAARPADDGFPVEAFAAPPVAAPAAAPIAAAPAAPKPAASTAAAGGEKPLKGCTIVLSGFQNPLRAEIRDKALSLGARVAPDWSATATHLIAAAANTPKYYEAVKAGHGFIVGRGWVEESFTAERRLAEAGFRVGPAAVAAPPPGAAGFKMVM
jgi:hypothetical protein